MCRGCCVASMPFDSRMGDCSASLRGGLVYRRHLCIPTKCSHKVRNQRCWPDTSPAFLPSPHCACSLCLDTLGKRFIAGFSLCASLPFFLKRKGNRVGERGRGEVALQRLLPVNWALLPSCPASLLCCK